MFDRVLIRLWVFNYLKTSHFYAENCISVRLTSCINIYLLLLSENFKDFTSNISIKHHQLVEKCNSIDVSTSCVVQVIDFNQMDRVMPALKSQNTLKNEKFKIYFLPIHGVGIRL